MRRFIADILLWFSASALLISLHLRDAALKVLNFRKRERRS